MGGDRMTEHDKDPAAIALGRKGGQAKTENKSRTARENIQKAIEARWKGHKKKCKKRQVQAASSPNVAMQDGQTKSSTAPSPNTHKRKAKAPK
jgi:hypothetical protein